MSIVTTLITCIFYVPLRTKQDQGHRSVCPDELLTTDETNEVERVNCECCGMAEDCTPSYISQIRENYCGKWLCGLCMEAVREKQRKYQEFTIEQALEAHMAICKQFNSNTRVNPKLSLADAMINFARRRSQLRDAGRASGAPTRPARTSSCGPWLGVDTRSNK